MTTAERITMINDFKKMVIDGMSKSSALDKIVEKYNQYNQPFIRSTFKSAAGWYY